MLKKYERSRKGSQSDTIHYEIDMFEYSFVKLKSDLSIPERNMTIECFLLHYRNLIEFFSGAKSRESDLSVLSPEAWSGRKLTPRK